MKLSKNTYFSKLSNHQVPIQNRIAEQLCKINISSKTIINLYNQKQGTVEGLRKKLESIKVILQARKHRYEALSQKLKELSSSPPSKIRIKQRKKEELEWENTMVQIKADRLQEMLKLEEKCYATIMHFINGY